MDATANPPLNTADSPLVPARRKRRTAFDSIRARQAALISAAVRRAKADRKRNPPPIPPLPSLADRLARLDANMRAIEQDMLTAKSPSAKAALASAHARVFAAWQTLTATPRPPVARIRGRRTPQSFPTPEPEPAQPAQVAQVTPAPEPAPSPAPAPIVSDTPQYVVVQDAPSGS